MENTLHTIKAKNLCFAVCILIWQNRIFLAFWIRNSSGILHKFSYRPTKCHFQIGSHETISITDIEMVDRNWKRCMQSNFNWIKLFQIAVRCFFVLPFYLFCMHCNEFHNIRLKRMTSNRVRQTTVGCRLKKLSLETTKSASREVYDLIFLQWKSIVSISTLKIIVRARPQIHTQARIGAQHNYKWTEDNQDLDLDSVSLNTIKWIK